MDLVQWDVLQFLLDLAGWEHLHISTVTGSHERSRAAHQTAAKEKEFCFTALQKPKYLLNKLWSHLFLGEMEIFLSVPEQMGSLTV